MTPPDVPLNLPHDVAEQFRLILAQAESPADRRLALRELAHITDPSRDHLIPAVGEALMDPDGSVRDEARRTLAAWGHRSVGVLLGALRAAPPEELELRLELIKALGQIGPEAGAAVTLLTHLQKDPHQSEACTEALARIRPGWNALANWSLGTVGEFAVVVLCMAMPLIGVALVMPPAAPGEPQLSWQIIAIAVGGGAAAMLVGRAFLLMKVKKPENETADRWVRLAWTLAAALVFSVMVASAARMGGGLGRGVVPGGEQPAGKR
jgi:hypothetical protein